MGKRVVECGPSENGGLNGRYRRGGGETNMGRKRRRKECAPWRWEGSELFGCLLWVRDTRAFCMDSQLLVEVRVCGEWRGHIRSRTEWERNRLRSDETRRSDVQGSRSWRIGGVVIMKSVSFHHGGARTHYSSFRNVLSILITFSRSEKRKWNDECITVKPQWWTAEVLDSALKKWKSSPFQSLIVQRWNRKHSSSWNPQFYVETKPTNASFLVFFQKAESSLWVIYWYWKPQRQMRKANSSLGSLCPDKTLIYWPVNCRARATNSACSVRYWYDYRNKLFIAINHNVGLEKRGK